MPEILASFAALEVAAMALHRPPASGELTALIPLARRTEFVAVFGERAWAGAPLLVIDGARAPDDPDERERSLEEFCRTIHALHAPAIALRTRADEHFFPAPHELPHLREALPKLGYWHDTARGGEEFLEVAGSALAGASLDPLGAVDLAGLRSVLGARTPAVVTLAAATPSDYVAEALACARGVFGA